MTDVSAQKPLVLPPEPFFLDPEGLFGQGERFEWGLPGPHEGHQILVCGNHVNPKPGKFLRCVTCHKHITVRGETHEGAHPGLHPDLVGHPDSA